MKLKLLFLLLTSISLSECTSESVDADCSTITGATFSSNGGKLAGMIQSTCSGSSCHSAGGKEAKEFLVSTDYSVIKPYLSKGATSVLNKSMPEGSSLSSSDLELWQCWKDSGFPE